MAKTQGVPPALAALGFGGEVTLPDPILFVGASGREKGGKTHLAMALGKKSEPRYYFNTDKRGYKVVEAFREEGYIVVPYNMSVQDKQQSAIEEFKNWLKAWKGALAAPGRGTLVADTWADIYDLAAVAEFGDAKVMPRERGPLNAKLKKILDLTYAHNKNVVLIDRITEIWEDDKPTGRYRRQGFKYTVDKTMVNVTIGYDAEKALFEMRVDSCGHPISLTGQTLKGDKATLAYLGSRMFKGTGLEHWGGDE